MKKLFSLVAVVLSATLMSGCAMTAANLEGRYAYDGAVKNWTAGSRELENIPKPANKIIVSVWKIADETGQFKHSENATDLSHAVTQGATQMLIKALKDSGWFTIVEREGWPNLAQEIKIREEMKRQGVEIDGALSTLAVPQYMISGAITEYENQPVSGGGGAGFRGFSFSSRAKAAHVATDLRITDISSGVILDAVSVLKRILSEEVDFNVFKYISFDHLLEAEVGYTANEPTQVCVREALEKSVINTIVNGVRSGLWKPAHPEDMAFFKQYELTPSPRGKVEKTEQADQQPDMASANPDESNQSPSGKVQTAEKPAQPLASAKQNTLSPNPEVKIGVLEPLETPDAHDADAGPKIVILK